MKPRLSSCSSSSASSKSPWRMRRKIRTMLTRIDQVEDPDDEQERARDQRARPGRRLVQREPSFSTAPLSPRTPIVTRTPSTKTIVEWPEREEEADAERPLPLAHQLARRVVDRPDVVGVEGVAQPERVGGDADPEPEDPARPEAVVVGHHHGEQDEEADHVQPADHRRETAARRHSDGVSAALVRTHRERIGAHPSGSLLQGAAGGPDQRLPGALRQPGAELVRLPFRPGGAPTGRSRGSRRAGRSPPPPRPAGGAEDARSAASWSRAKPAQITSIPNPTIATAIARWNGPPWSGPRIERPRDLAATVRVGAVILSRTGVADRRAGPVMPEPQIGPDPMKSFPLRGVPGVDMLVVGEPAVRYSSERRCEWRARASTPSAASARKRP